MTDKKRLSLLPHVGSAMINSFVGNAPVDIVDWQVADHQLGIIRSEVDELSKAVAYRNYNELRDGINDARFTTDGMASRNGIDVQEDFDELMISMISKFDPTMEEAQKSQYAYKLKKGIETEIRTGHMDGSTYYIQISAADQYDKSGKHYPKGKYLKSYRFEEPVYKVPENSRVLPEIQVAAKSDALFDMDHPLSYIRALPKGWPDASMVITQIRVGEEGEMCLGGWTIETDANTVYIEHGTDTLVSLILDAEGGILVRNLLPVPVYLDVVVVTEMDSPILHRLSERVVPSVDLDSVYDYVRE